MLNLLFLCVLLYYESCYKRLENLLDIRIPTLTRRVPYTLPILSFGVSQPIVENIPTHKLPLLKSRQKNKKKTTALMRKRDKICYPETVSEIGWRN